MGEQSGIILLSGGIDSAVAGAIAKNLYKPLYALTVEYGQSVAEKVAAIAIADWLGIKQKLLCRIPTFTAVNSETNYYPARNTVFLAHALQFCESYGIPNIVIGANRDDYNDYPDCRAGYFAAFEEMSRQGTVFGGVHIFAPLQCCTKIQVVADAIQRGVPLHKTLSCYHPKDRTPCGKCAACLKRKEALEANGLEFTLAPLEVELSGHKGQWTS